MADKPASLLTGTQRRRVRDDFADVDGAKRRRDQQKIRSRVAAGASDFRLLADYPDRQLELAFEDVSDEELTRTLADARLTLERVRTLNGIEREAVVEAANERKRELSRDSTESLREVDLRTEGERRREAEAAVAERIRPGRWKRLADALLRFALLLLVPASVLAVVAPDVADGPVGGVPGVVGGTALFVALGIVGVRTVKYDVAPAVRRLTSDPRGVLSDAWNRL